MDLRPGQTHGQTQPFTSMSALLPSLVWTTIFPSTCVPEKPRST